MLDVNHISKSYGPTLAVDDITFQARKGEVLGFLGPNGAGKTTTMRMITGFLPPSRGAVTVDGIPMRQDPIAAKRRIGYLPELPPIYPEFTVESYLQFVARLKKIPAAQRRAAVDRALERAALGQVRKRIIGRLSKGYRQRVGIAQAILNEPPLLILDEPTAGLDPRRILETRQLVRSLAGEHTIILSTHILAEAATTCERVIIIHHGKLVAVDTPENLTHRLRTTDTVHLEARAPAAEAAAALRGLPGVLRVDPLGEHAGLARLEIECQNAQAREALARRVVEAGWALAELRPVELSLEEIFLSLTAEAAAPSADAAHAPEAPLQ